MVQNQIRPAADIREMFLRVSGSRKSVSWGSENCGPDG
ncbi:hypothetical protein PAMC26577_02130 [Caballeronia sordidicola]|uniref:Uncharacterized protein n=1 Tax=Caballeronia sordidicola TaxID=196367 RepID=A0A242N6F7_CABSO|nr:hypothetical protein PAMC26577_02130 [Caballeronia sordidicola]